MWNNFFVARDEEARMGAAGGAQGGGLAALKGGRTQRRSQKMSDSQDGKIKLAFLVCAVGMTLSVLAVGTEFWVELAQPKNFGGNQTCQMAHYGLWKACVHTLWVADVDPERASCGPAELPGESNCTYFKFFTSGENAVVFKKTTNKNLNLAAAILALLGLTMMVTGSICIIMTLSKGVAFFLKPASFCFVLSGVLVLASVLTFQQSVLALLSSDHSVPLHQRLSWSAACAGFSGAVLIFGGVLFLLLALPAASCHKCLPHKTSAT